MSQSVTHAERPTTGLHARKLRLLHDLLRGLRLDGDGHITREALALGIDLRKPRIALVLDLASVIPATPPSPFARSKPGVDIPAEARSAMKLLERYTSARADEISLYLGRSEAVLLEPLDLPHTSAAVGTSSRALPQPGVAAVSAVKGRATEIFARLERDLGSPVGIGIGRYYPGLAGLEWSYHSAQFALQFGHDLYKEEGVYCLDDLLITAFIHSYDNRAKAELARYMIGPLEGDLALLETLTLFFAEDCSPTAAATRLAIHRNTLAYRLDKITALTGLDPRHFEQAVQLRLALDMHLSSLSLSNRDSDA